MDHLKKALCRVPWHLWMLLVIVLFGVFLRGYHFHDWMDFGSDQVKDMNVVNSVVVSHSAWPLYGPDMSHSGAGGHSRRFLLGPMYYYFEIVSASIFGNYPDQLAYPDLVFSILSIPLLYYFCRRVFGIGLSLAMTGIYTISFFALSFSHSAWNVNSIPFWTLAFLLALYRFISDGERTSWWWVAVLGVVLGVGVQLHVILLVLFPVVIFFACVVFLHKEYGNPWVWRRLGVIIALLLVLNLGQIIGEVRDGFMNSKVFLIPLIQPNKDTDSLPLRALNELNCVTQANTHMVFGLSRNVCDLTLMRGVSHWGIMTRHDLFDRIYLAKFVIVLLFSLVGYGLFIRYFRREQEAGRRRFLGLMLLYVSLSYLVMLPLEADLARYFVHMFFIPLFFLGFIAWYLSEQLPRRVGRTIIGALFLFIVAANAIVVGNAARVYAAKERTDLDIIVLGELESALDFMRNNSGGQKEIRVICNLDQRVYMGSFGYIAKKSGVDIVRLYESSVVPDGTDIFFITSTSWKDDTGFMENYAIEDRIHFGEVEIYKLRRQE